MLPPERVTRIPRRKYAPRSMGHAKLPGRESFLGEHLSTMRVRASSGEGPSALAIIGLTRQETAEKNIPVEELPGDLDVDLEVEERKFVTIVGPSGCGKSTLFNVVAGLIEPSKGAILVNGQKFYLKARNFPDAAMSPQGRR